MKVKKEKRRSSALHQVLHQHQPCYFCITLCMPRITRTHRQSQKEDLNIQTAVIHSGDRREDFTLTKAKTLTLPIILLTTPRREMSEYIFRTIKISLERSCHAIGSCIYVYQDRGESINDWLMIAFFFFNLYRITPMHQTIFRFTST